MRGGLRRKGREDVCVVISEVTSRVDLRVHRPPYRMMRSASRMLLLLVVFVLSSVSMTAMAQQQYNNTDGYTCSGAKKSCSTYALYRTIDGNQTLTKVGGYFNTTAARIANLSGISSNLTSSTLLKAQQPLYIPLSCACKNVTTQRDVLHKIVQGDTFWLLSVTIYGGLTTYQAMEVSNPTLVVTDLQIGQVITVPIFCACPTAAQISNGTNYLLTYVVFPGDTPSLISSYFNISTSELLAANELTPNVTLGSNTTLLIPLVKLPALSSISFSSAPTPSPTVSPSPSPNSPATAATTSSTSKKPLYIGVAVGVVGMACGAICGLLLLLKVCQKEKPSGDDKGVYKSADGNFYQSAPMSGDKNPDSVIKPANGFQLEMVVSGMSDMMGSDKPTLFSYQDLQTATNDFSEANNIQGSVYKGRLAGQTVAIKQMKGNMSQELKILCQVHHSNLVKLVGLCVGGSEHLFLVYEYAENGSLSDCLCNQPAIPNNKFTQSSTYLPWTPRVQIALDVASGLEYIHNYTNPSFVHKDVKSSNILLDANLRAKVANFGMAKSSANSGAGPLLTRHITGTQGYMAPEYLEHGLVTPKADVFAFGVVLLEILSGKEAVVRTDDDDGRDGKERALSDIIHDVLDGAHGGEMQMERFRKFMDPQLHNAYPVDTAFSIASLARTCVDADPAARPSMKDTTFGLSKMLAASLEWETSTVFGNSLSNVPIEAR